MFNFSFMKDGEDRKIRTNRKPKPEDAEKGRNYTWWKQILSANKWLPFKSVAVLITQVLQ